MLLDEILTVRSGSIGNVVHSRNPHGPYTRARTVPADPNTGRQQGIRLRFGNVSRFWSGALSTERRTAWAAYAASVTLVNRIGVAHRLSGQQMFIRCNAARMTRRMGMVLDAPAPGSISTFGTVDYNRFQGIGLIRVNVDSADEWRSETGAFLLVYIGQPRSADTHFYAGPWRLAGWIPGDAAIPPIGRTFNDPWGPAPGGMHTWGRSRVVRADGRASSKQVMPFTEFSI